jgi:hypothetical protein
MVRLPCTTWVAPNYNPEDFITETGGPESGALIREGEVKVAGDH